MAKKLKGGNPMADIREQTDGPDAAGPLPEVGQPGERGGPDLPELAELAGWMAHLMDASALPEGNGLELSGQPQAAAQAVAPPPVEGAVIPAACSPPLPVFRVELKGHPPFDCAAASEGDAIQLFKAKSGLVSTSHPIKVTRHGG